MRINASPLVVIDPGHGGQAPRGRSTPHGVMGPAGTQEKEVSLELSRRLARRLGGVAQVRLTRESDANRSLSERIAAARRDEAAVFVSLHADRRPGEHGGAEVWIHDRAEEDSRALAERVGAALEGGAPIQRGPMAVLDPDLHAERTAACLVEVDDLSSALGERRLRDPAWLDAMAEGLARGVEGYLQGPRFGAVRRTYGNPGELFVPVEDMVRGIDVSHWNGAIDWTRVAADHVVFAYIKATEGRTFVDDRFAENWAGAAACGIARGAYHVLRSPTSSHVDDQVRNFLTTVTHANGDLPPALDVEQQHMQAIIDDFRAEGSSRTEARERAREWLLSWLTQVETAVGMRPILYVGLSSIIHKLARDAGRLVDYGLWYPRYRREPNLPEDAAGNLIWPHFSIWQHTSDGAVDGIRGRVDLNRFNGDLAGFRAWSGGTRGRPLSVAYAGQRATPTQVGRSRVRGRYGFAGPDVVANEVALRDYLAALDATSNPRGAPDDVDLAMEVVDHWRAGHAVFLLPVRLKVAVICELITDPQRGGVESAVLALLSGATDDELRHILLRPAGGLQPTLEMHYPASMATLVASRRAALQWVTAPDEQIRDTFDAERILDLRETFEANAQRSSRDNCITVIKNTRRTLFGGDATVLREVGEAFAAISDLRVTFYGTEMVGRGLAVERRFRFAPDNGNREPTGLTGSPLPWDWVTTQIGAQQGWHVFLVGVFNGYHSATLFVEQRANATFAYWADQWNIASGEDLQHASGSTHGFRRYDRAGLHAHVEHYTKMWWNTELANGHRWEATHHLYKLASHP
jgi:lysozyme